VCLLGGYALHYCLRFGTPFDGQVNMPAEAGHGVSLRRAGNCEGGTMTEVSGAPAGGVFISYRRGDAASPAGRLFDRLVDRFGAGRVFEDVDSIEPGDDFAEVITATVESCAVLLAVIGPRWLAAAGQDGRRRLDDPADIVRLEIEAALVRGVQVIPVLVDGAQMPRPEQLPASLGGLAGRQALELSHAHFGSDIGRLMSVLDGTLSGTPAWSAARKMPPGHPVPDRARPLRERRALGALPPAVTCFRDDETGFVNWRDGHPDGYIVNSERNPRPSYLVLHRATCGHLTSPKPLRWTKDYIKFCSLGRTDLVEWAKVDVGGEVTLCPTCLGR
jgi:hypothetical protein